MALFKVFDPSRFWCEDQSETFFNQMFFSICMVFVETFRQEKKPVITEKRDFDGRFESILVGLLE